MQTVRIYAPLIIFFPQWDITDMAEQNRDQAFLEYVVKAIVKHPEDVKVERTVDDRGVLLTLHLNQEDMGYVIGRQGQTARALRILLKIVGAQNDSRVNMKIHEPEDSRRVHQEYRASSAAAGSSASAPAKTHGDAGLVSDKDLADLGI